MAHSNNGAGGGGPGGALGDLYTRCVQMVNENKVSSKNAFDLGLIDKMDDIVAGFMGGGRKNSAGAEAELRFHEASCTIEASSRIYACRVDAVHTETYKVLGGLSAVDVDEEGEADAPAKRRRVVGGTNTLEKNEANIRISGIEADQQSDPYFRRMTALFDAGGAKGLLLTHLPLANDLSLVFNGDLKVKPEKAEMEKSDRLSGDVLWKDLLGYDDAKLSQKLHGTRICHVLDGFKRELWGEVPRYTVPDFLPSIKALGTVSANSDKPDVEADSQIQEYQPPGEFPANDHEPNTPIDKGLSEEEVEPLQDDDSLATSGMLAVPHPEEADDTAAFDKLFEAFGDDNNQFAYFNDCWSKGVKREKLGEASTQQDQELEPLGQLQPLGQPSEDKPQVKQEKEKVPKRPLFSLLGSEDCPREIETEPCHKHMLNEKQSAWQLNKDVPPYMIDRITMPNWPMCSKYDFVCLGLRPHLMLKLVSKPPPESPGPHGFRDLFSTVVIERPDAFPWLPKGRASMYEPEADNHNLDAEGNDPAADDFNDEGDLMGDDGAMPSHLDADPQELFLRPEDDVVNALGNDVVAAGGLSYGFSGADLDLCERPQTVDNVDIGYSRNSKYVNVKLVKKHLWDCISGEVDQPVKGNKKKSVEPDTPQKGPQSFQKLISGTVSRMNDSETSNLSVAVCFVCQLHLCNEKNLELEMTEPLRNFQVHVP